MLFITGLGCDIPLWYSLLHGYVLYSNVVRFSTLLYAPIQSCSMYNSYIYIYPYPLIYIYSHTLYIYIYIYSHTHIYIYTLTHEILLQGSSLYLPIHNWHTIGHFIIIGHLIIILVPEDSKCSNKRPPLLHL